MASQEGEKETGDGDLEIRSVVYEAPRLKPMGNLRDLLAGGGTTGNDVDCSGGHVFNPNC
jgi:hypothetical protein